MKSWYVDLAKDVCLHRQIFAHVGSFHRTSTFSEDINAALSDVGVKPVGRSIDALASPMDQAKLGPGVVIVVPDFERALRLAHPEVHLRRCRPRLQQARELGCAWLVISRSPESAFPLVDGSSVTIDSAGHRMRHLKAEQLVGAPGVTPENIDAIARHAGGSRAIAEALIHMYETGLPQKEQIAEARKVTLEVLTRTVWELGPDLLAWLQRWVLDYNILRVSTTEIRNDLLLELRSAAVGTIDAADDRVVLFPPPFNTIWREALNSALSDLLDAPTQWGVVAADLFYIERRLRRSITILLEDRYGTRWAERLPEKLQLRVVELFRNEASPRVQAITEIDRPLDWVTLGDLFELVWKFALDIKLDGLSANQWRTIADAILSVRNRVSHMQLLREEDGAAVRRARWRITSTTNT